MAKLGVGGLITVLFLPETVILVVIGVAVSWWLAVILGFAYLALIALLYIVARSPKGFLGRLLGVGAYEPGDYSQYTPRNLFLAPVVIGLPAAIALIIVAILTANASWEVTVAIAVPSAVVGYGAGGLLWSRMEKRRRQREAAMETPPSGLSRSA